MIYGIQVVISNTHTHTPHTYVTIYPQKQTRNRKMKKKKRMNDKAGQPTHPFNRKTNRIKIIVT